MVIEWMLVRCCWLLVVVVRRALGAAGLGLVLVVLLLSVVLIRRWCDGW